MEVVRGFYSARLFKAGYGDLAEGIRLLELYHFPKNENAIQNACLRLPNMANRLYPQGEFIVIPFRRLKNHVCDLSVIPLGFVIWQGMPREEADKVYRILAESCPGVIFNQERDSTNGKGCRCNKDAGMICQIGCQRAQGENNCSMFTRAEKNWGFKYRFEGVRTKVKEEKAEEAVTVVDEVSDRSSDFLESLAHELVEVHTRDSVKAQDCRTGTYPPDRRCWSGASVVMSRSSHGHRDRKNRPGTVSALWIFADEDHRDGQCPQAHLWLNYSLTEGKSSKYGVAWMLQHSSVLINCSDMEPHGSPPCGMGRKGPKRIGFVNFLHDFLSFPNHGWERMKRGNRLKWFTCITCSEDYGADAFMEHGCKIKISHKNYLKQTVKVSGNELVFMPDNTGVTVDAEEVKKGYDERKEKLKCSLCTFTTEKKMTLICHVKEVHKKRKCPFRGCDTIEADEDCFRKHLRYHIQRHFEEGNEYYCEECDYHTKLRMHLVRHVMEVHALRDFQCHLCEYKAITKANLTQHMSLVHDEVNRRLREKNSRNSAETQFHNTDRTRDEVSGIFVDEIFECELCDGRFSTKGNLIRHRKARHENETVFPCNLCDYNTTVQYNLERHVRGVHGNGSGTVTYRFGKGVHLTDSCQSNRKRKKKSKRVWKCQFCSKSFPNFPNKRRHEIRQRCLENPTRWWRYCRKCRKRFPKEGQCTHKEQEMVPKETGDPVQAIMTDDEGAALVEIQVDNAAGIDGQGQVEGDTIFDEPSLDVDLEEDDHLIPIGRPEVMILEDSESE